MSGVTGKPETPSDATTVGEDFPIQQTRVRELIGHYREIDGIPGVDVKFAIAAIEQVMRRADEAMASADVIRILRSYEELKGCE